MPTSPKKMPRAALKLPALILFVFYTLYCVIKYFEQHVYADIVLLYDTLWADVLDVLAHLFEICGMATIFGFLLHAILHYGVKLTKPLCWLSACALLFKYILSIFAVGLAGGMLYFPEDLLSILLALLIELAQIALALLLGHRLIDRFFTLQTDMARAAAVLGHKVADPTEALAIRKPLSRTNPVQRTAFWSILAVCGCRTVAYIIDEIAYTAAGALFSPADIPIVLLYWLILIAIPTVIGYFLTLACVLFLNKRSNADAQKELPLPQNEETQA